MAGSRCPGRPAGWFFGRDPYGWFRVSGAARGLVFWEGSLGWFRVLWAARRLVYPEGPNRSTRIWSVAMPAPVSKAVAASEKPVDPQT
jgi:hypothetical protein